VVAGFERNVCNNAERAEADHSSGENIGVGFSESFTTSPAALTI